MKMIKLFLLLFSLLAFSVYSCATKKEPQIVEPEIEVVEEPEPEPEVEVVPEPPVEVVVEEPKIEKTAAEIEYERSVGDVNVPIDVFEADKAKIASIISEVDKAMKTLNYKSWLTFVAPESRVYWSKNANLRKAENRLPVKGVRLTSLEDYFRFVFIPSRASRQEELEIRYISGFEIKVVQIEKDNITGEERDIVYYYFNKIKDKWMIHIPPVD